MKYTMMEIRASYLAFMVGRLSKMVSDEELIEASDAAQNYVEEYFSGANVYEPISVRYARKSLSTGRDA